MKGLQLWKTLVTFLISTLCWTARGNKTTSQNKTTHLSSSFDFESTFRDVTEREDIFSCTETLPCGCILCHTALPWRVK